ncbi:telomere-protecting terminal protein Tpg [Streptomyces profundus]|uniref:telomere-protecting terminal protein Tpg n=1 Tax=Streptomyces profundus TaxID=2867410 RepID=UPI001D16666C|nr:XRE family transcriptional regulator [Streptomyces sp. MA3_2.13]UED82768.1 XRE family transcriptional regulator [Streptomyces sp. MA3_2.13]
MGEIEDAITRADNETFTRQPPKTLQARINFLMKQFKTTRAVAAELGVTPDSVNRYRRGARKNPPKAIADRIDAAVRARWQPRVRKRRQRHAATVGGITVETRARIGYTAPAGTTDDGRLRRLTVHLPPPYADRLFTARDTGTTEDHLRGIVAEGLRDIYFQDGGTRALGLTDVALTDIDYLDLEF